MCVSIRTVRVALSIAFVALSGAVACSDEPAADDARACVDASEATADVGASTGGTAIAIAARDDRFDPNCVVVPGDTAVSLIVRNAGRHPHDLTLPNGSAVSVDAGQVAYLETRVTGDSLRFVCTIHPGMGGELGRAPSAT
jgi:hypothetical protein